MLRDSDARTSRGERLGTLADTRISPGILAVPKRALFRQRWHLGAIAAYSLLLPLHKRSILEDLSRDECGGLQIIELLPTQVVGSPFHGADIEWSEDSFEKGDIFVEQLLLEALWSQWRG